MRAPIIDLTRRGEPRSTWLTSFRTAFSPSRLMLRCLAVALAFYGALSFVGPASPAPKPRVMLRGARQGAEPAVEVGQTWIHL